MNRVRSVSLPHPGEATASLATLTLSLSQRERAGVRAGKADDGAAGLSLVRKRIPMKVP